MNTRNSSTEETQRFPPIAVPLERQPYEILVKVDLLANLGEIVPEFAHGHSVFIVTDENVGRAYRSPVERALSLVGLESSSMTLPAGETTKSAEQLGAIYDAFVEANLERRSLVIALGGGVIGDLAGYAAATFRRGLPVLQIPTSLVAQVDSAIGGKTGINLSAGKNLVGAFHQPVAVLCDPNTLVTLPDREFRSGLAEVVKYGILADRALFELLENNADAVRERDPDLLTEIVYRSAAIKAGIVARDEYETLGERILLNLGHTIGHALEADAGYGNLLHGEAVSIGTVCACRLAERTGRMSAHDAARVRALLERLGLPVEVPGGAPSRLLGYLRQDKKRSHGTIRFVLPTGIGSAVVEPVADDAILAVLESV